MNDEELQTLIKNACKAAGWRIKKTLHPSVVSVWIDDTPWIVKLTDDDGDSRWLQVACKIALHFDVIGGEWCAEALSQDSMDKSGLFTCQKCAYEPLQDDAKKAARMAVLRCAALLGEAIP